MLIVSSYTANLAAFLTVDKLARPIQSFDDLVSQNMVKFGLYKNKWNADGFSWLKLSRLWAHNRIYDSLKNNKNWNFENWDDSVAKVKAGDYAAIMQSSRARYLVNKDCDLEMIEGSYHKFYAIGLQKGIIMQ